MDSTQKSTHKRINLLLSSDAHAKLVGAATESGRTMTEIIRLGLGLVLIALENQKKGLRTVVTTDSGEAVREIVLPS